MKRKLSLLAATAALTLLTAEGAYAQKTYDTGVTDTEIKIGNVEAYWGRLPPMASSARPRKPISR